MFPIPKDNHFLHIDLYSSNSFSMMCIQRSETKCFQPSLCITARQLEYYSFVVVVDMINI